MPPAKSSARPNGRPSRNGKRPNYVRLALGQDTDDEMEDVATMDAGEEVEAPRDNGQNQWAAMLAEMKVAMLAELKAEHLRETQQLHETIADLKTTMKKSNERMEETMKKSNERMEETMKKSNERMEETIRGLQDTISQLSGT
ncbi:hypothetical protein BDY21DRAFT_371819, partial [Lineolata rhizophorae]